MADRITPYNVGSIHERIDEIVVTKPHSIHLEMMDKGVAWMRVGDDVFWIEAKKGGQLYVRKGDG